ncbi:hypothetical protein [Xanthomonas citri]|uniref:hypothetical protein n=1 Tax=Xanthomonas citri TaxID=346 RepID=UPI003CCFC464
MFRILLGERAQLVEGFRRRAATRHAGISDASRSIYERKQFRNGIRRLAETLGNYAFFETLAHLFLDELGKIHRMQRVPQLVSVDLVEAVEVFIHDRRMSSTPACLEARQRTSPSLISHFPGFVDVS